MHSSNDLKKLLNYSWVLSHSFEIKSLRLRWRWCNHNLRSQLSNKGYIFYILSRLQPTLFSQDFYVNKVLCFYLLSGLFYSLEHPALGEKGYLPLDWKTHRCPLYIAVNLQIPFEDREHPNEGRKHSPSAPSLPCAPLLRRSMFSFPFCSPSLCSQKRCKSTAPPPGPFALFSLSILIKPSVCTKILR